MVCFTEYLSPVGNLLITCSETGLTGLWMNKKPPKDAMPDPDNLFLKGTVQWLEAYFAGKELRCPVPLNPSGTEFQKRIWNRLLEIPWGEACSYGDIAREITAQTGKPMSAQAVGGAVGSNPISILIPCHRVVGAKGQLTGYAGGLHNKVWLLRHEGWEGIKENDNQ